MAMKKDTVMKKAMVTKNSIFMIKAMPTTRVMAMIKGMVMKKAMAMKRVMVMMSHHQQHLFLDPEELLLRVEHAPPEYSEIRQMRHDMNACVHGWQPILMSTTHTILKPEKLAHRKEYTQKRYGLIKTAHPLSETSPEKMLPSQHTYKENTKEILDIIG